MTPPFTWDIMGFLWIDDTGGYRFETRWILHVWFPTSSTVVSSCTATDCVTSRDQHVKMMGLHGISHDVYIVKYIIYT